MICVALVFTTIVAAITYYIFEYTAFLKEDPVTQTVFIDREDSLTQNVVLAENVSYQVESVIQNLSVPWSIAFTNEQRMLITERNGDVRVALKDENENWQLETEPLHSFEGVSSRSEEGLMGMALDPNYSENNYVYFCYAYINDNSEMVDRVSRLTDNGDSLSEEFVLIDDIPAAQYHAGCQLGFGPDDKLYITTGDATDRWLAQDLDSLAGKMLRLNPDGSIPEDNPFDDSPIWSYGHRNSQGFDWYPGTDILYASEHGPSLFDGPAGGDEINLIKKGGNYGWPEVSHEESMEGMIDPELVFTPAIAPSGAIFYDSELIPEFKNNFFVAMLRGEGILRVVLDEQNPERIIMHEKLDIDVGRIRALQTDSNGILYFATSNVDGRGQVNPEDDQIYRLVPR